MYIANSNIVWTNAKGHRETIKAHKEVPKEVSEAVVKEWLEEGLVREEEHEPKAGVDAFTHEITQPKINPDADPDRPDV